MVRKNKRKRAEKPAADKPQNVSTDLGALLRAAATASPSPGPKGPAGGTSRMPPVKPPPGPASPKRVAAVPSPTARRAADAAPPRDPADLRRLNDAYAGVVPLSDRSRAVARPAPPIARGADPRDAEARARLGALVGADVHFQVERDEDGRVAGLRQGEPRSLLRSLRAARYRPEAELDLHGLRSHEAAAEISRFVRLRHRAGARSLMIVHGAGKHSEGGQGVLGQCTVEALTSGGAAPLVRAFATAHTRQGGLGALAVYLK